MKPHLALFRAGPSSLHPHAVQRLAQQNFDYALSWFGDAPPADAEGAAFVHMQKGAKWPGLEQTLRAHWDTISQYRYVWLPDDDLLVEPEVVSRMFAICTDLKLDLAQPALTPDSYYTHLITLQHARFQLRFTNFVEIMAPVLSREMLDRVMPTLAGQLSGFGMDTLWPRYTRLGKVAILDDTPVKHTRPVGGPNYRFNREAGVTPGQEDWLVSATHFVETQADFQINIAGLLQSGDAVCIGHTTTEAERLLGHLLKSLEPVDTNPLYLARYLGNHFNFWSGGEMGSPRYPRAMLRIVLNRELGHAGIKFPPAPKETDIRRPMSHLQDRLS